MIVGQEGGETKVGIGCGRLSSIETVAGVARGEGGGKTGEGGRGGEGEGEAAGLDCDGRGGDLARWVGKKSEEKKRSTRLKAASDDSVSRTIQSWRSLLTDGTAHVRVPPRI